LDDFKSFYERHGTKLWLLLLLVIVLVIAIGCIFLPEIFWDKFVYRYYWGPVEIDALESGSVVQSDGYVIEQGYTLLSEITYGVILIFAMYGIYGILRRWDIAVNLKFVLSVLPYFFLGGTLRVMEDAELLQEPYVYLFISPLIYFVIGAIILPVLLYLVFLERKESWSLSKKLSCSLLSWFVFNIVYILMYFLYPDSFNYLVHPAMPLLLSGIILAFFVMHSRNTERFDPLLALFSFGLFLLAFSLFVLMLWPSIESWRDAYLLAQGRSSVTLAPLAGPAIISLSAGFTFGVYIVSRLLSGKYKTLEIFTKPINLLIIFGQMMDACATFVGVDFYSYSEKHPIPRFFFESFGTSIVFLPIKMALACAIIYLIDISFSEELDKYPILRGLIKIMIIVLGLAPGTRDMLRTAMGI
jgi:uncharacterized membrane protein